jgi:hypothetical protein
MGKQNALAAPKDTPWSGVVLAFGKFVAAAAGMAGIPGGAQALDTAVDLIRAIEGAQDAQAQMLNAIHEDVELLRLQAFRTGKIRLEEIARIGPDSERYATLLGEAETRFLDAEPMCSSAEESAVNQLYLGLTLGLKNSRKDASHWLAKSAVSGTAAAQSLAEEAGNIKVFKSKKTAALAAIYYPVGVVVLFKKRRKKQEASAKADALAEFLPFVNAAVSCHNALGIDEPMPSLELTPTGKRKWMLQEVLEVPQLA